MDKEVLREIWHGQLPLCFKLHPDDVSGRHLPEPYYMMVPRVTYFPLVLDRVVKYFNRFADQNKEVVTEMWLDYDGQPLKWQHPIGLSWDLFGSNYDLPWRLMLHFSNFPAQELVRCNTKSSIETNFMSSIKEADTLKHKGAVIKNMVKKDHNQLWSSLVNDKFEQFWSINKKLMDRPDNELFRFIPFKLYFPDYTFVQKVVRPCTIESPKFSGIEKPTNTADYPSMPVVQDYDADNKVYKCGHPAPDDAGETKVEHRSSTMLDLIQVTFSNRMNELLLTPTKKEDPPKVGFEEPPKGNKEATGTYSKDDLIDVKLFKYRFITHGIEIPFDTPLQWLSEHFSYPDNFLHICAVLKDNVGYH